MNLIEQLGGYEKASKFCDKEIKEGGYPYGLIGELLEYRRQHNIFEVGDWIVSTLKPDAWWKSDVMQIKHIHKNMFICESKYGDVHQYNIRHATDEEISAGHRL